ncbi:hypothetical protein DNTS_006042 [Danionella cerebrum]|uniref:Chorein N-terminal domain-containing protein n=1 Tax=Danionella cerebrum TaxID=2873325 RepID=A0A553Q054_9TELE|nr:hypothetical protein DNTS_006042 [Danionella translucida]
MCAGYGYSLIRRVLNNVCVCVNNLILKYVEDDIVLSVNITSAECVTVDELWDPAFMDITPPDLVLRKRISFSDCTVCLDKRDASGKIEFYQDPLIYKCSFTTRLHFTYENTHAKIPAVIKQIPMFLRLVELALSLYYGEMEVYPEAGRERAERDPLSDRDSVDSSVLIKCKMLWFPLGLAESPDLPQPSSVTVLASGPGLEGGDDEEDQGWVSWAWSFIPAMVGAEGEENEQSGALLDPEEMLDSGANQSSQTVPFTQRDPVLSISFYCTRASLTFKVSQSHTN